jgi:hypothetical protein
MDRGRQVALPVPPSSNQPAVDLRRISHDRAPFAPMANELTAVIRNRSYGECPVCRKTDPGTEISVVFIGGGGIERVPTPHVGPTAQPDRRKGIIVSGADSARYGLVNLALTLSGRVHETSSRPVVAPKNDRITPDATSQHTK